MHAVALGFSDGHFCYFNITNCVADDAEASNQPSDAVADPGLLERGACKGTKPKARAPAGASPENVEKLDAISCNWHIFLGSEWPRISFKIGP